jgi:hypothetical protein
MFSSTYVVCDDMVIRFLHHEFVDFLYRENRPTPSTIKKEKLDFQGFSVAIYNNRAAAMREFVKRQKKVAEYNLINKEDML